ncbi:MAG: hypothetical protein J7497_09880 [Chitinophagaceae bacterium]|nr:hypothetical protein [Chitinophagaceae bacterium]
MPLFKAAIHIQIEQTIALLCLPANPFPPGATYRAVTDIRYVVIDNLVAQVYMTAQTKLYLRMFVEQADDLCGIRMHVSAQHLPFVHNIIFDHQGGSQDGDMREYANRHIGGFRHTNPIVSYR